jgi:hypothetical protein
MPKKFCEIATWSSWECFEVLVVTNGQAGVKGIKLFIRGKTK